MDPTNIRRDNLEDILALAQDVRDRADTIADVLAYHARREDERGRNRLRMARQRRNAPTRNPLDAA